MPRDDRDYDGHRGEQQHLPPAAQAERAAVRELREVVEESDRAARERPEQDRQRLQAEVAHGQEADRRREQDEQTAHRRRPLLRDVMLRAVLADVLPELVATEELDEAWPDRDRDDQRHERGDEDPTH